jgi:DNA-binding protein H-NS
MTDPRLEDHVVGLELQLVELVEQQQRAEVQHRTDDAARLDQQIAAVQQELATTAEAALIPDEPSTDPDEQAHVLAPTADEVIAERPASAIN